MGAESKLKPHLIPVVKSGTKSGDILNSGPK